MAATILKPVFGLSLSAAEVGLFIVAGALGMVLAFILLQRPMFLLYGIIVFSVFITVFREVNLPIASANITLSGFIWFFFAVLITFSLLTNARKIRVPAHIWPFIAFSIWVLFRWIITPTGLVGLKDVLWYSLPVLVGLYLPLALGRTRERVSERVARLETLILYTAFVPAALFVLVLSTGLAKLTWRGPVGALIGVSRGIPSYLLIVLCLALAAWRYDSNQRRGRLISLLALALIWFTLARMAGLLALGLLALRVTSPRRKWQILIAGTAVAVLAYFAITNIPILQQRFFFAGDWDVSEGLSGVITGGRNVFWPYVYAYALEKPVIGWGLGTSRLRLADLLSSMYVKAVPEQYPHNEYLQAFHDMGIVGLVLMVIAWLSALVRFWTKWENSKTPDLAKWNMAAALSILVVLTLAITGNTIHYPNVIAPAVIVVGLAEIMNRQETYAR